MNQASRGPVVIDTGVFSARLVAKHRPRSIPLVAHDAIFNEVEPLELLTRL